MQAKRSLIIGASLGALINWGAVGAADAQQNVDATPPVKHKTKSKPKVAANSSKEMADQLQALRDQVNALQRRLDSQTATEQQTQATADRASAQAASATTQAATATAATAAIPAAIKTAVDDAKPKTDKIYYKGMTVTLGGFFAGEYVYRQIDTNNDISTRYQAIPFANNSVGQTNQTVFTPRQSRVSALMQGDPDSDTHLAGYLEMDFQGAAQTANSTETNSYNPRLRSLYATADWDTYGLHLLAGQAWSLVTLNSKGITPRAEVLPPTIDGQYMPGFTWTRQPQLRLTKDFDKQFWLAVSLENPQTSFYTGANALPTTVHATYNVAGNGTGFNTSNTYSLNRLPDVIGKIAYEPTIADRTLHVEALGLYSSYYERVDFSNQDKSGGGFGGGLTFQVVPNILDFQVSGLAGKGIGRYGSAQLSDVTLDPLGNIQPIHEVMGMAGLTLHATPIFDVYAFAGEEKESAQAYDLTTATGVVAYGYGNPLYSNTACFSETGTGGCVGNLRVVEQATGGFWVKPYVGSYGMIRLGMQFSRTEIKAFSGKGGAPVNTDNIVLASFRYYPFTN